MIAVCSALFVILKNKDKPVYFTHIPPQTKIPEWGYDLDFAMRISTKLELHYQSIRHMELLNYFLQPNFHIRNLPT